MPTKTGSGRYGTSDCSAIAAEDILHIGRENYVSRAPLCVTGPPQSVSTAGQLLLIRKLDSLAVHALQRIPMRIP